MRRLPLVLVAVLAVAACGHRAEEETQTTVTKNGVTTTTITKREVGNDKGSAAATALSIDANDFKANVEIPGLSFGGDHMDLSGMKLYPGSTVKGVHVHATDHGDDKRGQVVMNYSSPAAPAVVAQHMADQARKAGFTLTSNTTSLVSGSKREDDGISEFSSSFAPDGAATVGVMTITGKED